jgi:ADP-ribose pyrophosphatase YjhB (NUDIX family)
MKYLDFYSPIKENDIEHAKTLRNTGFWGKQGAGCIFLAKDTKRILLPYRSSQVLQPHTWGVWGGAIDNNEDPATAVKREVEEEAGYNGNVQLIPLAVYEKDTFRYYNFLAIVDTEFKPKLQWETENYKWVEYGNWPKPLHFGLEYLISKSGDTIVKTIEELEKSIPTIKPTGSADKNNPSFLDRFKNLLKEKIKSGKQLRGIWYHGTSAKYLKDILSQGLIPNPKEKSWDIDPNASIITLDRTTYGGVYVTKNLGTALSSAWRTAEKTKDNRLIVILDLQPKSLIADEDAVARHFVGYHETNALWFYKIIKHGTEYPEYEQELENERERFAVKTLDIIKQLNNIDNPKLESVLKNLIKYDGFDAMVTRIAAYLDMSSYYNQDKWYRNWDYRKIERENIPLPPEKREGELVFRKFIDRLTRTLKSIARNAEKFSPTGRSLEPIRFTGNNKIICILEIIRNEDTTETVKLRYGKVPQDFIDQYRNRKSAFDPSQIVT